MPDLDDDAGALRCQLCRRLAENGDDWMVDAEGGDPVRVRTEIAMTTDAALEQGYHETVRRFTVCDRCWGTALEPWFASLGAKPAIEES